MSGEFREERVGHRNTVSKTNLANYIFLLTRRESHANKLGQEFTETIFVFFLLTAFTRICLYSHRAERERERERSEWWHPWVVFMLFVVQHAGPTFQTE